MLLASHQVVNANVFSSFHAEVDHQHLPLHKRSSSSTSFPTTPIRPSRREPKEWNKQQHCEQSWNHRHSGTKALTEIMSGGCALSVTGRSGDGFYPTVWLLKRLALSTSAMLHEQRASGRGRFFYHRARRNRDEKALHAPKDARTHIKSFVAIPLWIAGTNGCHVQNRKGFMSGLVRAESGRHTLERNCKRDGGKLARA